MESAAPSATAPEAVRGLAGQLPANKALEALERLATIGALRELPYPGRPHSRIFEPVPSIYWDFVGPYVAEREGHS